MVDRSNGFDFAVRSDCVPVAEDGEVGVSATDWCVCGYANLTTDHIHM